MKIKVLKKDIKKAMKFTMVSPFTGNRRPVQVYASMGFICPIAQAIRRQLKTNMVSVCGEIIIRGTNYKVPRAAERFMTRFDSNKPVKPFEFTLKEVK